MQFNKMFIEMYAALNNLRIDLENGGEIYGSDDSRIKMIESVIGEDSAVALNRTLNMKSALEQIMAERDRVAEGEEPSRDLKKYPCFDDWAADIAEGALK